MTQRDRLIVRIVARPPRMRFSEVQQVLEMFGWTFARQRGSHTMWTKPGEFTLSVATTDGGRWVKRGYLNEICDRLRLDGE